MQNQMFCSLQCPQGVCLTPDGSGGKTLRMFPSSRDFMILFSACVQTKSLRCVNSLNSMPQSLQVIQKPVCYFFLDL